MSLIESDQMESWINRSFLSVKSGPFPLYCANSQNKSEFWEKNSSPATICDPFPHSQMILQFICYHSVELASFLTHLNSMYLDYSSRGHCALSHYLPQVPSAFCALLSGKSSKGFRTATHMPRYKVCSVQNLVSSYLFPECAFSRSGGNSKQNGTKKHTSAFNFPSALALTFTLTCQ